MKALIVKFGIHLDEIVDPENRNQVALDAIRFALEKRKAENEQKIADLVEDNRAISAVQRQF